MLIKLVSIEDQVVMFSIDDQVHSKKSRVTSTQNIE